jgi:hypothetical protein
MLAQSRGEKSSVDEDEVAAEVRRATIVAAAQFS